MGSGESKTSHIVSVEADCLARASAASPRLPPVVARIITLMQGNENNLIPNELGKLTHDIVEEGGEDGIVCRESVSKGTTIDHTGIGCKTCSSLENVGYCLACFVPEQHHGHNLIDLESAFLCQCGDKELLAINCCRHGMPILVSYPLFQSEASYLLQQLYHFRQRAVALNIQNSSFEAYQGSLVMWLDGFAAKGRQNQVQVGQALIRKDGEGVSGLRRLIESQTTTNNSIHSLLEKVLPVMGVRDALLEVIYIHFTNPTVISDEARKGFYSKINILTYLQCPRAQERYFSNPQHCRLALQNTPKLVQSTELLLSAISVLLRLPNAQQIVKKILRQQSLAEFCRLPNLGRTTLHLSALYLPVVIRAVKLLENDLQQKEMLALTAKQCFTFITKKEGERLPLERAFAVIAYSFFGKLPNLKQLSQLLDFNLNQSQCVSLVLDSLSLKKSYGPDYLKSLKHASPNSNSILAADQLFVKMFSGCIESPKRLLLDQGWMGQMIQSLSKIIDEGNEAAQITQKRAAALMGLQSASKLFAEMTEALGGEVCEEVVKGNWSRIMEGLLIIYQNDPASEFKAISSQFVSNQSDIIQFIKTRATVDSKRIHVLPKEEITPLFPYLSSYLTNLTVNQQARLLDHLPSPSSFSPILAGLQIAANPIWDEIASFVEAHPAEATQLKDAIIDAIKAILQMYFATNNPISASLLRLAKLVALPQVVQKALEKAGQSETKKQVRNDDKKRAKMEALKAKQRHALQGLVGNVQEGLECIICKNSKQGAAYMLGHFRYNNFFSKLLGSPRPFVEFNSCGHSIHEECLRESHNGEFRIWYPCVLCKSIANILMPVISQDQPAEAQLHRIIDFLKNFGGIYTFLYEDRPELREFSVEDIYAVFGLLLRSVTLQLALFPLLNPSYFSRSQFPTVRFLFRLLRITSQKLPQVDLSSKIQYSGEALVPLLYQFSSYRLQELLIRQPHPLEGGVRQRLPSSAISLLDQVFKQLVHDGELSLQSPPIAQYRELVHSQVWQPPRDLFSLQNLPYECKPCKKTKDAFETCLFCGWTCCQGCSEVRKVHISEQHQNEGIFINSAVGKYSYLHQQLVGTFGSLYSDYLGEEPSGKAKKGQYELKQSLWEKILGDLLSNRLHSEIMKFY